MASFKEDLKKRTAGSVALTKHCPEAMKAFGSLHQAAVKEGVLSTETKELIALGIAISIRCEGCILAHVKASIDAGATREEMSETIEVALLMSGGPGTAYGALAIEMMEEFLNE